MRHILPEHAVARAACRALLACTLAGMLAPAHAQPQAGEAAEAPDTLPAVTVSARGVDTQEEAKDLPFGISVTAGEAMEQRGLASVEDVLRATPGVHVNSSGGANVSSIYIRGVGALYPMSMDDTSVVVNIDGSPVSSRHISLGNLDVEQETGQIPEPQTFD